MTATETETACPGQDEAHEFRATPDAAYGHLVWASCTCGEWRTHGAIRVWLAVTMHRRHRETV